MVDAQNPLCHSELIPVGKISQLALLAKLDLILYVLTFASLPVDACPCFVTRVPAQLGSGAAFCRLHLSMSCDPLRSAENPEHLSMWPPPDSILRTPVESPHPQCRPSAARLWMAHSSLCSPPHLSATLSHNPLGFRNSLSCSFPPSPTAQASEISIVFLCLPPGYCSFIPSFLLGFYQ